MTPEEQAAFDKMKTDLAERDTKIKEFETKGAAPKDPPKDTPPAKSKEDEDDLLAKSKKATQDTDAEKTKMASLESALKFNMAINEFVKTNEALLPAEVLGVLKAAEKEKFDTPVERSNALRSSIIQSFFAEQKNVDLLTASQKNNLDNFLGLTKIGKEQKSEFIYENIFEPTIEQMKRINKAVEVGKANQGYATGSTAENNYKDKLIKISKKSHLGEKGAE